MTFLITGITGRVGGAAAEALVAAGAAVRTLARDPDRARPWTDRDVEVRRGDIADGAALADALDGVEGAFLLQPTPSGVARDFPEGRALIAGIVEALRRAPPPRAVALSSVGADRPDGLGNITQSRELEAALAGFDLPIAFVRAGAFVENNLTAVRRAAGTGVLQSFLQPVDRAFPMVATRDIGDEVATLLLHGWAGRRHVVELGSMTTPADLAAAAAATLGRDVRAEPIPRDAWDRVFAAMGFDAGQAENWGEMQDGFNSGWIGFGRPGTVAVPGTTTQAEVFAAALEEEQGR